MVRVGCFYCNGFRFCAGCKHLQNKITFVQIGKHFKVRFFDSKVEGATHYFKETFYCRILIKLDVNSGGEKYRR